MLESNPFRFSHRDIKMIADEVERQQATPMHVYYLANAVEFARTRMALGKHQFINTAMILQLGSLVLNKDVSYRMGPAVFRQGRSEAVHPQNIEQAIFRLIRFQDEMTPEEFVKEFLLIHPFEDGNGRVAWILWNVKVDGLYFLEPLPEFDF